MHVDWTINVAAILQAIVVLLLGLLLRGALALVREIAGIRERLVSIETKVETLWTDYKNTPHSLAGLR